MRCSITARPSCAKSRSFTPIWSAGSGVPSRPSSAWATGSAATATAIPMSTRRRWTLTVRLQAETILRHYLIETHHLGAELSMSRDVWSTCSPELEALADASGDANPHRADEFYRRALIGVYARLAGTLTALTGGEAMRHAAAPGDPYPDADELCSAISRTFASRCIAHHGAALVEGRLALLIRAAEIFGFHMATTDLRQMLRPPRGGDRGTARGGADRARLFGVVRRRARRAAAAACSPIRVRCAPPTSLIRERLARRTGGVRNGARSARKNRRGVPSAITSSAIPKASAICSK